MKFLSPPIEIIARLKGSIKMNTKTKRRLHADQNHNRHTRRHYQKALTRKLRKRRKTALTSSVSDGYREPYSKSQYYRGNRLIHNGQFVTEYDRNPAKHLGPMWRTVVTDCNKVVKTIYRRRLR